MIYGIIGIWVLCGLLAYGQWIGGTKSEVGSVLGVEADQIVLGIVNLFLGPVGLSGTMYAHRMTFGKWWYKPSFQFRTSPPTDSRFRK